MHWYQNLMVSSFLGFFSDIFLFLNTFSGSIKIIQVIKLKSKRYESLYV